MSRQERENKEFYDLNYDVWRSGGNPDRVDRERFQHDYDGHYDFNDVGILNRELNLQKPQQKLQPEESYEEGE